MITAAAWAAPFLVLAGCAAYAYAVLGGRRPRMRGPLPARDQDIPYDRRKWLNILSAWEAPPADDPTRSRT